MQSLGDKLKVLVVDDEDFLRDLIKTIITLNKVDVEFFEASNATKGLEIMQENVADIALLDINMPGAMNGIQLLKEIRIKYPETTVLMLTGYASKEHVLTAIENHAYDFIEKPFDNKILLHKLMKAIDHNTYKNLVDTVARAFIIEFCGKTEEEFNRLSLQDKSKEIELGLADVVINERKFNSAKKS